ncbi:MAG: hypothetical protein IH898_15145 [Planctomycetes bacterium]|nr:hypothetical protein [Planctomycetota bacterium]
MRVFRVILVVGVATALLYARSAVSTQSASGATQSNTAFDALTPSELYHHLFGETITDAKRPFATLETVSALHTPHGIRTDPFSYLTSAGQATRTQIAQRALASSKSSRPKPRRTRPAKRTSSRTKSISQRTRQVGKEARTRSTQRLNANKARAKQRIKRTSVPARRKGNIARKRPPLVQVNKARRAPARKTLRKRSPATPQRKKPKAKGN